MNKLNIVPFLPEHAEQIELIDESVRNDDFMENAKSAAALGPAWTGVRISDGKIIGCAGIMITPQHEGEAWALFSTDVMRYKKEIYSQISWFLKYAIADLKLKRVRSYLRKGPSLKGSFAGRFGFKEAGILEGNEKRPECIRYILETEDTYVT